MKKKVVEKTEAMLPVGQVMSLLENMNEGIQLIAEQHGGIITRLDSIDVRLDGIDSRLDGIDVRLDNLDSKVDRLQGDVTDIKFQLSEKVDRVEFVKLEKRMIKVERALFSKRV